MAEEKAAEKAEEAPAGPKMIMGLPFLTFLLLVVNLLVTLGCFGFIYYASLVYKKPVFTEKQMTEEITKKVAKQEQETGYFAVSYPETTVTLRVEPGTKGHFATVETTLVCPTVECETQVKAIRAKVEDRIQSVIASRSYTELQSLETKFRVKHEILNHVNSFLKGTAAVDLLFTSFLVQ